jgi:hypothetical protein
MTVSDRFWSKVVKSDGACWDWIGAKSPLGYGQLYVAGRKVGAHRLSWLLMRGEIAEGLNVLHRCDRPCCVNPDHLFLGTMSDNTQDMIAKGRHGSRLKPDRVLRGEGIGVSKLTEDQVGEVRFLRATYGYSYERLARAYGVSFAQIGSIITRRTWKHVTTSSGENLSECAKALLELPVRCAQSNTGERNGLAKLTRHQVDQMRRMRAETGASFTAIAAAFSVSKMTANNAISGRTWK